MAKRLRQAAMRIAITLAAIAVVAPGAADAFTCEPEGHTLFATAGQSGEKRVRPGGDARLNARQDAPAVTLTCSSEDGSQAGSDDCPSGSSIVIVTWLTNAQVVIECLAARPDDNGGGGGGNNIGEDPTQGPANGGGGANGE